MRLLSRAHEPRTVGYFESSCLGPGESSHQLAVARGDGCTETRADMSELWPRNERAQMRPRLFVRVLRELGRLALKARA